MVRIRTLKDYNEAGVKKAAVGAKVMTDSVAVDTAFDIPSQRYYASLPNLYFFSLKGRKSEGKRGVSGGVLEVW